MLLARVGPGVWERAGAGVCERVEEMGPGVCERVRPGPGVVGRAAANMDAERMCVELKRLRPEDGAL